MKTVLNSAPVATKSSPITRSNSGRSTQQSKREAHCLPFTQANYAVATLDCLIGLPPLFEIRILNCLHQVSGELFSRSTGIAACHDEFLLELTADVKSHLQLLRAVGVADMPHQHGTGTDHATGIGVLSSSFIHHPGSGTVDCFKHGVLQTDVCGSGSANTALKFGRLVSENVTVQIRQSMTRN